MATIVLYFQVHQPWRLRRYSVFDAAPDYFDDRANREILLKVADNCYRPATEMVRELVERHEGRFRLAFSITCSLLDQCELWAPDVIDRFRRLVDTGHVELLGETEQHSLSFLKSEGEFLHQLDVHTARMRETFGVTPRVFRNTELTYNNDVAACVAGLRDEEGGYRFKGALTEGVDDLLAGRSPGHVYRPPESMRAEGREEPFSLLLKNYRLSDDIAFRFGNRGWSEWPMLAERYIDRAKRLNGDGPLCNLFLDFEAIGEHQHRDTGVFDFVTELARLASEAPTNLDGFLTPSEAIDRFPATEVYGTRDTISWADSERDLSAWLGNAMQQNAFNELYALEEPIKSNLADAEARGDADAAEQLGHVLEDWRRLTNSDHFYYMCTKYYDDGGVHKYFSPYSSPYDAYINVMNVLDHLRTRVSVQAGA